MTFRPLDKPVQYLKGVGPRRAEALGRLGIRTARDLLYHVPRRYDDASTLRPIANLEVGMDATTVGRVRTKGVVPTRSGLRIFQAVIRDNTGMITCAWPGQPWLDHKVEEGDLLLVTGPVRFFHGRQFQPREFVVLARKDEPLEEPAEGTIFVSYPASEELPQWVFRRIFAQNLPWLLEHVEDDEFLDAATLAGLGLPSLPRAFDTLHRPRSLPDAEASRRRLAFDELFFLQIVQAQAHHRQTEAREGIRFERTNRLIRPLHDRLPFRLTEAQARVLREICADMTSPRRMNRLLQGDVGSGKTVVALFAMLLAVESGYQAALMAPTELLAEQHARTLNDLLAPIELRVLLLTGRLSPRERRDTLSALGSGDAPLVVGTHALIQEGVEFARLGLVVTDEQHRFGVRQRMALGERGSRPDVLVMSATPIPRSLALACYGDLDLSVIDELPPGRRPVTTMLRRPGERGEVYELVRRELRRGRQAYVIYPLISESEKVDLLAAEQEFERLSGEAFSEFHLGLLHGQLPGEEKERAMRAFLAGDLQLLVATSVVEVGIDVPNATVMVIEHGERFGLSQLHQLRGRVGRGGEESYCIVFAEDAGDSAFERMRTFESTEDGFAIARADLRIRGQGDLFGAQQHGRVIDLRYADLERDEDLLRSAHRMSRELIARDPELDAPEHADLRRHLDARYGERVRMFEVG
ncbi:MAG: ATP-dependent DNA helicase RecG [Gemmatimonadetes bacterium]|nr:ATP-dependent DNA helicase RecG [Gemmatimonadota bacterium]